VAINHQVDLVLVNPGGRFQIYQSLGDALTAIEPPVWAGLMATFVRRHGFSVVIVDAEVENLTPEETAEQIALLRPILAAVVVYGHQPSASTQNMPAAGAICTALKRRRPDLSTLLVGGHVAALPEQTLGEEHAARPATGRCGGWCTVTGMRRWQRLRPPSLWTSTTECPVWPGTCCLSKSTGLTIGTVLDIQGGSPMFHCTQRLGAPTTAVSAASRPLSRVEKRCWA